MLATISFPLLLVFFFVGAFASLVITQVRIDRAGDGYATWRLSEMQGLWHHNG